MSKNQKTLIQQIKEEYEPKPESQRKLETLIALNERVKLPALIFAYAFGIIGALVLGLGMCLAMKVIGDLMALGIVIGILGIAMVSVNYFIYKGLLNSRKKQYADQILELSNELLND